MKNITKIRRYLHMYPEMSMQEYKTTKKIASILKKMNINFEIPPDQRGIIAKIDGKKDGSIAVVCDIDALPIQEDTNLYYRSKINKRMHACGHDANTAIVIDFLSKIKKSKNPNVNIYAIFQSDEEIARGAIKMKKFSSWYNKTDAFVKLHVHSMLDSGKFMVKSGNILMGAENFKKKNSKLSFKIKYKNKSILESKKHDLFCIIDNLSSSPIVKPVDNDGFLTKIAIYTLNFLNFKNEIIDVSGGDDFSFYIDKKKGLYVFYGVKKEGLNIPPHSCKFEIDDENLEKASLFLKEFVENYSKLV